MEPRPIFWGAKVLVLGVYFPKIPLNLEVFIFPIIFKGKLDSLFVSGECNERWEFLFSVLLDR